LNSNIIEKSLDPNLLIAALDINHQPRSLETGLIT